MIPALDPTTGLLPPGRHRASWQEVEDVFVRNAPHLAERRLLFARLRDWADQCWSILPKAELWIDGGFVRHDPIRAPFDVDVVAFAELDELAAALAQVQGELSLAEEDIRLGREPRRCPFAMRYYSLWTLASATVEGGRPPRAQPFGSSVDGFVNPKQQSARDSWHRAWSGLATGGPEKGYLEVIPSA